MITHNQNKAPKVHYHFSNPLENILLSETRTRLLNMIKFTINKKTLVVDMGCFRGTFTGVLSSIAPTVGLDIDKNAIARAKMNAKHIEFICADLCYLPFRRASVDIAVCASVLEYIENLEESVKQIRLVLKKGGILIVGYPIETKLLKVLIELSGRRHLKTWDPLRVMEEEEYRKNPHTHKQMFPRIRDMLSKYFSILRREKMPSNYFPDFLSIYECAKLIK